MNHMIWLGGFENMFQLWTCNSYVNLFGIFQPVWSCSSIQNRWCFKRSQPQRMVWRSYAAMNYELFSSITNLLLNYCFNVENLHQNKSLEITHVIIFSYDHKKFISPSVRYVRGSWPKEKHQKLQRVKITFKREINNNTATLRQHSLNGDWRFCTPLKMGNSVWNRFTIGEEVSVEPWLSLLIPNNN